MTVSFQRYPVEVPAGEVMLLAVSGTRFFFKDTNAPLSVALDIGGRMAGLQAGEGYAGRAFTGLALTNEGASTVTGWIVVSDDEYVDRRITGTVDVTGGVTLTGIQQRAFTSVAATITSASGTLAAANLNRQYLLVQNNGTGDIFVNLAGVAATLTNGVKVAANGGALELSMCVPTALIRAIGTIASNPNIVVVQA